ncbi:MAG: peptidoglycan-binding protein [Candidatus Peribacteraceae bacterium]|jgi:peptidoglycan hydrolase-like protein with peptidoglycan-binding domain/3D (Asp-Asp-Asp) domain-containing protein|nr:peptidoglycan-binding protein [Candidatus Peribacteraceae bacterium]MDP7454529.1 peptidoglycan-binding protein [Candidatus Peribacteraceae bacterium]
MNKKKQKVPRHILGLVALISFAAPADIFSQENLLKGTQAFEQEFIITAYYSPVPGQCCYVKGGLKADKILNGEGLTSSDGTKVFPGMLAAPASYAFGTRVRLPGLGVLEVHDRGGAIKDLGNGVHRLDIWVGHGEEGLARALSFGVQRITGTVYPLASRKPDLKFAFENIPTFYERLNLYMPEGGNFLAVRPKLDDSGPSVRRMQEYLKKLGYFRRSTTNYFGRDTERSLMAFIRDFRLNEPSDQLTERTAAFILAAVQRKEARDPVGGFVDKTSAPSTVMEAQRILRFLGYWDGKTDGEYSDKLASSILKFQQENFLVGTAQDPGAGRIGPITLRRLLGEWNRLLVVDRVDKLLDRQKIEEVLANRGEVFERFLGEGEGWSEVRRLQERLAAEGFFPPDRISGYFGPLTKEAVRKYQISRGLITSDDDTGAGYVGPKTLHTLKKEKVRSTLRRVRGEGWRVL